MHRKFMFFSKQDNLIFHLCHSENYSICKLSSSLSLSNVPKHFTPICSDINYDYEEKKETIILLNITNPKLMSVTDSNTIHELVK